VQVSGGYMVAIEGIDAVGKKTQTSHLNEWLRKNGARTAVMAFPDYHTAIGKEIKAFLAGRREYPLRLQHMLFAANRWEKSSEINSHLRENALVIVNRYTGSNLAYGIAHGLDADWLWNLEMGLPRADLVIVLDAHPKAVAPRRPENSKDKNETDAWLQQRAQEVYRSLAAERGWNLIDAERPEDQVAREVLETLKQALKKRARRTKARL